MSCLLPKFRFFLVATFQSALARVLASPAICESLRPKVADTETSPAALKFPASSVSRGLAGPRYTAKLSGHCDSGDTANPASPRLGDVGARLRGWAILVSDPAHSWRYTYSGRLECRRVGAPWSLVRYGLRGSGLCVLGRTKRVAAQFGMGSFVPRFRRVRPGTHPGKRLDGTTTARALAGRKFVRGVAGVCGSTKRGIIRALRTVNCTSWRTDRTLRGCTERP